MLIQEEKFKVSEINFIDEKIGVIRNKDIIYQGEINDSYLEGYGKLWKNNLSYHGQFKKNKLSGEGILNYFYEIPEDNFIVSYKGDFVSNKKEGKGYELYHNKEYYIGDFSDDLRHGHGILYNKNGTVKIEGVWNLGESVNTHFITLYYGNGFPEYKGEYKNGKKNGNGIFWGEDGHIIFDGEFENNKFVKGKLFKNNSVLFDGFFQDNYPLKGIFYYENGRKICNAKILYTENKYKYYKCGYAEGLHRIYKDDEKNSLLFEGELLKKSISEHFKSDYNISIDIDYLKVNICFNFGTGDLYYANGKLNKSFIVDEKTYKLNGKFEEFDENNSLIFEGNFNQGNLEGIVNKYCNGKMTMKITYDNNKPKYLTKYDLDNLDNLYYQGYCDDKLNYHGEGKLYYDNEQNNIYYEGNFENGRYHGEGKIYNEDGVMIYEGNFKLNKRSGDGKSYYPNSQIEYEGNWVSDEKHGQGTLYSDIGELVFTGNFHYNEIQYD